MAAAEGTLRAQARAQKSTRVPADGRERMDKDVVKAVLASPLVVPWPTIPRHLQNSVLATVPKLVPDSVASYHTGRARCHKRDKNARRKEISQDKAKDSQEDMVGRPPSTRPAPPKILQHLVLGINETIKALERGIDDLKFRLMLIADTLNGTGIPTTRDNLLPTAPQSPSPPPPTATPAKDPSPLNWIIIPLLSISPESLVSPIPQYCASYNALVYQWTQLKKVVHTRLKEDRWTDVLGEERDEVRVVPLGNVEVDMAGIVGLRRLACLGIRQSHPDVELVHNLLSKSVLHPPRYNITLPFPTSNVKVHTGASRTNKSAPKPESQQSLPVPNVHYAPLTIKGITTTAPVDGNARKQKRLVEVRKRRIEVKEKKREERRKEFLRGVKDQGTRMNSKDKSKSKAKRLPKTSRQ